MTEGEQKLWRLLRRKQLSGFRFPRQAPIGRYTADFFCPKATNSTVRCTLRRNALIEIRIERVGLRHADIVFCGSSTWMCSSNQLK
jgi:hypothetical protein